jgi:hypothetical protein
MEGGMDVTTMQAMERQSGNTVGLGTPDYLDRLRAEIEWRQSNLRRLPDNALLRQCAEQQLENAFQRFEAAEIAAGLSSLRFHSNIN